MKNVFKLGSIKQFIDIGDENPDQEVFRKQYESKIYIDKDDERCVISDISCNNMDEDGDMIIPQGCDFSRFMKNPIILADHASYQLDKILGHATQIEVLSDRIRAKIQLNDLPLAQNVYKLIKAGDLRGNSIGFIIKGALIRGTKEFDSFIKNTGIKVEDGVKRIINHFKLIESSFVAIPCCDNALVQSVSIKSIVPEPSITTPPNKPEVTEVVEVKEVKEVKEVIKEIDKSLEGISTPAEVKEVKEAKEVVEVKEVVKEIVVKACKCEGCEDSNCNCIGEDCGNAECTCDCHDVLDLDKVQALSKEELEAIEEAKKIKVVKIVKIVRFGGYSLEDEVKKYKAIKSGKII